MNVLETIEKRKTIRSYKSDPILEEHINEIIKAGCLAPIASAKYDKVHITVVTNLKILDKMSKAVAEYFGKKLEPFYNAPVLILISGKKYPAIGFGSTKWSQESIEFSNTACILENMLLAATELGLGSAYLTGFISCFEQDPQLLSDIELPKGFRPLGGMVVGHINKVSPKMKAMKTICVNYVN